jgi:hypothetical protein
MAPSFSRILLASEHTEFDTGAEAVALALARHGATPLSAVLPVLSNAEFETAAPQLAERADELAATRREAIQALAQAAGVPLTLRVRRGDEPFAEIVQAARELPADLIVLRRRGQRSFLANLLVGEMVGKVLAHAPCSVLLAPRGARLWRHRVLVALDPLVPDAALLDQAALLAAAHGLPLQVLCVASGEARAQAGWPGGWRGAWAALPESAGGCQGGGADSSCWAATGRKPRPRVDGGVAQKVIGLAECPVLVHVNSNSSPS